MIAFCTYCSKNKHETAGNLPAIELYDSPRIRRVHEAAQIVGAGFLILSGKFGLLAPATPIPFYDHLLIAEEVGSLVEIVMPQLEATGVDGVVYFTVSFSDDEFVRPYHDTLASACARMRLPFIVATLEQTT